MLLGFFLFLHSTQAPSFLHVAFLIVSVCSWKHTQKCLTNSLFLNSIKLTVKMINPKCRVYIKNSGIEDKSMGLRTEAFCKELESFPKDIVFRLNSEEWEKVNYGGRQAGLPGQSQQQWVLCGGLWWMEEREGQSGWRGRVQRKTELVDSIWIVPHLWGHTRNLVSFVGLPKASSLGFYCIE